MRIARIAMSGRGHRSMNCMLEGIYFGTAFLATVTGVALFRRYGERFGTIDIPNERSSHSTPTLRGGGIVIVAVCLCLYLGASIAAGAERNWSYVAGALLVSIVSWIDDARDLPAWARLAVHSVAAAILLSGSGAFFRIALPGTDAFSFGSSVGHVVSFLWVVWMINAYNFMDGIDGIAGGQGLIAGVGWATVGLWLGNPMLSIFGGVIALSSVGFLVHNWSPARVFLGDVGSAFMGYTLAAMPLLSGEDSLQTYPWLLTAAVSFVWLFLFDTVFTLVRRIFKKEKIWTAHRQHLYQRLVISGWPHASVSLLYICLSAAVSAAFILTLLRPGTSTAFLLSAYMLAPIVLLLIAIRKKV